MKSYISRTALVFSCAFLSTVAQSQHPPSSFELAAQRLPKPQVLPNETPRPCQRVGRTPPTRVRFASPDVENSMSDIPNFRGLHATLNLWRSQNFPKQDGCWTDWDFYVKKFQAAIGSEVTGILSPIEVSHLSASLEGGKQAIAQAAAARQQATAQVAELRQTAPRIFDIPFGLPLDLPLCPQLAWGQYPAQTCKRNVGREVYVEFSESEQPGWVMQGSVRVELFEESVATMRFRHKSQSVAVNMLNDRFGMSTDRTYEVQNVFGARTSYISSTWARDGLTAKFGCQYQSDCQDQVEISSREVAARRNELIRRREEEAARAGRKF